MKTFVAMTYGDPGMSDGYAVFAFKAEYLSDARSKMWKLEKHSDPCITGLRLLRGGERPYYYDTEIELRGDP